MSTIKQQTKWFRSTLLFFLLIFFLLVSIVYAISIGSSDVPVHTVFQVLKDQIFQGGQELAANAYTKPHYQIIWNIRLPRVLFGALCGSGLALCGAAMQSLVLNPIADPYILGISSGASAGAAWALLMPVPFFSGQYQVTATAMLGALLASACVYFMARMGGGKKIQPVTLLLSGTAVNAVMSAVTSLLIFLAKSQESIAAVYNWQMGSLASAQWTTLWLPFVGVSFGLFVFTFFGKQFNILMMGDEDAAALGLNVKLFRSLMFAVCSVVVASLVAITGIIGFVGLMVPHIVRLLAGTSNNQIVIPLSGIFGAIYLTWADAAARSLFGAAELPLGIITAFIGAPFFFWLMLRRNYGGRKS